MTSSVHQFESLDAFFAMGTHGVYVWSAWGLVLLVFLILIWSSYQARKKVVRDIFQQHRRETSHSRKSELDKSSKPNKQDAI